jgi:hypothetical protein
MREHEFISEIRTVNILVPLTPEKKDNIGNITTRHFGDDIYYGYSGDTLVVAAKVGQDMTACAVCPVYKNPAYILAPKFMVPKNLYSWVRDAGKTTTAVIRAIIKLANMPVLGDLEMTPPAKRAFKKKIDDHEIKAKIFNLCTGDITQYDPDIWDTDDDCRVMFLEHAMGMPATTVPLSKMKISINEGTYNWSQVMSSRKHCG